MIYNRTFENNLHPLKALIYNTIAFSVVAFYFSKSEKYDNLTTYLILFSIWLIILVIVCALHIDYFFKAKTVEIDISAKFIAFDKCDRIYFNQIKDITLVIPPALYRKDSINVSPFDDYHYARFVTNDGKRYFFTCLLSQNIEHEVIQIGIPLQIKKRLIAFTFF
jgi:hypothetical protein